MIALMLSGTLPQPRAAGHPSLSEYVQHDVTLHAGSEYLDLTIHLTFFGRHAERQEIFLDGDGDGQFSTAEREAFAAEVLEAAARQVQLHVGTKPLTLVPLFDPEFRIIIPEGSGEAHRRFELRLDFFAPLPTFDGAGVELAVHNGLYPELPAMAAFHVVGSDVARLHADCTGRDLGRPPGPEATLVLRARLETEESTVHEVPHPHPVSEGASDEPEERP